MVPVGWAKFFVCGPGNPLKLAVFGLDLDGLEPGFGNRMAIVAEHRPKLFTDCGFLHGYSLAISVTEGTFGSDPLTIDLHANPALPGNLREALATRTLVGHNCFGHCPPTISAVRKSKGLDLDHLDHLSIPAPGTRWLRPFPTAR
jgi:hypothetical protein